MMQSSAAMALLALLVAMQSPKTLDAARSQAEKAFKGWTYGDDPSKKQINCVQFVVSVIEAVHGRKLEDGTRKMILISDLPQDELVKDDYAVVRNGDPRTTGLQKGLVDSNLGKAVKPENARSGDLVQYWMRRKNGTWFGHAALIESVRKDGEGRVHARLYGASQSGDGIGISKFELMLSAKEDRRVYLARLSSDN